MSMESASNPPSDAPPPGAPPPDVPPPAPPPVLPPSGQPVRYEVEYPEKLSRLLIFVKWFLAIPHYIILYALGIVAQVVLLIAFFAILFTKKFPKGLFDLVVNVYRWQENVTAYVGLLRDEYPPFSWEEGKYPLTFQVDHPPELGRFLPLIKWLLALPHYIVLLILYIIAIIMWIISWFAILITGRFPRPFFNFIVGTIRWTLRVQAYVYFLRDDYPPFSMKP